MPVLYASRFLIFLPALLLAGCMETPRVATTSAVDATAFAAGGPRDPSATGAPLRVASASKASASGRLMNPATTAASGGDRGDYHIAPLDMLEVSVFQVPDLSKTVRVAADGNVTLPLIGEVMAAGKSAHQLEAEIAAALGAKYLQNPEVSVFVSDAVSQRVTVEGAVNKPGVYPTAGGATLMQVIAMSGGLADIADSNAIVVFRTASKGRQAAVFDYKAIRKGTIPDPVIQGGDIVAVDQSGAKAAMKNIRETIGVFNLFTPLL